MRRPDYPMLCAIAGYDPTGRAGVDADRRVMHHAGIPGTTVLTAITLQDDEGVHAIVPVSPPQLVAQLEAVMARHTVGAWKTGMLANAGIAHALASLLHETTAPLVVDPVLHGSAGGALLTDDALDVLRNSLIPRAQVITPNVDEAATLLGRAGTPAATLDDAHRDAEALCALGASAAVITGLKLSASREVVDIVALREGAPTAFTRPRVEGVDPRGTGCVFASCVATALAGGAPVAWAIERAGDVVHAAITRAAASEDPKWLLLGGSPFPTAPKKG